MGRIDMEKIRAWREKSKAKSKAEKEAFGAETAILNANSAYAKLVDRAEAENKKESQGLDVGNDYLVSCRHLTKIYANRVEAVHDFNLDIKEGEFIVLVGPSGCGKSTTLRMIAGLEDITYGSLFIDGKYSNDLLPKERGVSMVFQSYALYPHMSVYDNMAFGLSGLDKEEIDARIKEASALLEITPYLDRKPTALSGGQCQRVALGRAIVRKSRIFLLDEPLSNLDAKLRVQMRSELVKLHERLKNTMIYVTHDQTEAMTMADRIVVLKNGYVMQIGTPREIYDNPANVFVATFLGSPTMNIIEARYESKRIVFPNGEIYELSAKECKDLEAYYQNSLKSLKERKKALVEEHEQRQKLAEERKALGSLPPHFDEELSEIDDRLDAVEDFIAHKAGRIYFGIRPEDVRISNRGGYKANLDVAELLGAEYYVHVYFSNQKMVAKVSAEDYKGPGNGFGLIFAKGKGHLFDFVSGERIG